MDILEIYIISNEEVPEWSFIIKQYFHNIDEKCHSILYIWDKDYDRLYCFMKEKLLNFKIKHIINAKRFRHFFEDKEITKLLGYNIIGSDS